jgi:DNA-binding XRE family transcriptional regulator
MQELLTRLVETSAAYQEAVRLAQDQGPALVREARKRLGLTQRELAEKIGVNYTYISKIENGHSRPSRPVLAALAELLRAVS